MSTTGLIHSALLRSGDPSRAQQLARIAHFFKFHCDIQWSILHDGSFELPRYWNNDIPAPLPYPEMDICTDIPLGRSFALSPEPVANTTTVIVNEDRVFADELIERIMQEALPALRGTALDRAPAQRFYDLTFSQSPTPWEELFHRRTELPPMLNLDVDDYGSFPWGRRFEYAWSLAQARYEPGLKTLDVGSLYTFVPKYLATRGLDVVSIDIDETFVEVQQRQAAELEHPYSVQLQDIRHTTFPDASFDQILLISMIEHIPNGGDIQALQECHRILKPGGLVIITTPYDHIWLHEDTGIRPHQFLQRYYNMQSVITRLMQPPLFEMADLEFIGGRPIDAANGKFDLQLTNPTQAFGVCVTLKKSVQ